MAKFSLIFVIVLSSAIFNSGYAFNCIQCGSAENGYQCGENETGTSVVCPEGTKACTNFACEYMGYVSMIFKGCADSSELDEPMGCQTSDQNGFVCELCFCDSDDCNK